MRKRHRQCSLVPRSKTAARFGPTRFLLRSGEKRNRLVQVRVHEHSQDQAIGFERHVNHPERIGEMREFGEQLSKHVAGPPEEKFIEHRRRIIG